MTKLSIAVGTYNRLALLQKCLGALTKRVYIDHEIIVADAGSTDGTLEYLQHLPGVRLVNDRKLLGQAQSMNRIFKNLQSEFVCWLSDDNVIVDGALDVAVDILKRNPDIGMVALKVKDVVGPREGSPYLGSVWESGVLNCNQGVLPVKIIRLLGGFDEEFRDYGIDADLTTRVLLARYKVVYTKQVAIHHYRNHDEDNWIASPGRKNRLERARELYRQKHARLIESSSLRTASAFFSFRLLKYYGSVLRLLATITGSRKLERWKKTHLRDLVNIFSGRFISRWDLIRNLGNPYYLVQEIPLALLMDRANSSNTSKDMKQ